MGRPSSIIGTDIHEKVDAMLDEGETLTAIRAVTGASLAALSRYAQFRKSHIARVIDDEPNLFDLVARLLATADDARTARLQARQSGSPAARARAIHTESQLIAKILDTLGVDDVRVAEQMDQAQMLATAVRDHVLEDSEAASIIDRLRAIPGLEDVAVSTATSIGELMSTTEKRIRAGVGDVLTALSTVTVPDPAGGVSGINLQRASTLTVTASFVEDTTDRTGFSWLSDLSEDAQVKRWGEQRFVVGDVSDQLYWWEGSSASAKLAYDHEMYNASLMADPEARAEAVTAVRRKFANAGLNPSNQVITMRLAPDAENIYSPKDDR